MTNTIDAYINFSFKGKDYSPTATIDLDKLMQSGRDVIDIHRTLAIRSGIDTYSYLYDAMGAYDVSYSNPVGLATEFLNGDQFDFIAFRTAWDQHAVIERLKQIAQQHLNIDNLDQHSDIAAALLAAYNVGRT